MGRKQAVAAIESYFDDGRFFWELARRVAIPTASQDADSGPELHRYLAQEMTDTLQAMGFACRLLDNPAAPRAPFLFAERREPDAPLTLLTYGHGDVVRGMAENWDDGFSPWQLTQDGDKWFGRGSADNKGQHSINIAALRTVLETRGQLGFSCKLLIETGEEIGSPGLHEVVRAKRELFAADLLIASDGPRLKPETPTLFMGARSVINFDLIVPLRKGAHHSGNWGGILASPGLILSHALSSLVDRQGRIRVEGWRPPPPSEAVRAALQLCAPSDGPGGEPAIDLDWGEPGLTPAERLYAWSAFEVLAFETGDPAAPANAIPPVARAHCSLRFTADTQPQDILPALRQHLDAEGFPMVEIVGPTGPAYRATRMEPDHPWVRWAAASLEHTTGKAPALLPNLGGTLPNDVFAEILGLPTVWVPHSYAACSQHAPGEHLLAGVVREGLAIMTGLFWDLGEAPPQL